MEFFHRHFQIAPFAAACLALVILCVILFVIPIGMADNGDFFRVENENNLYFLSEQYDSQFFNYFVKDYGVRQYYNENAGHGGITTSQNLFIQAAMLLDNLFTGFDNVFDIRFLAALQILLCVVAIYMLTDYLTYQKPLLPSLLIGFLCVLIFADTAYSAYFNSFYAEGIVYTCFLIALSSILLLSQERYNRTLLLAIFLVSSLLLTFSKQQNAPLGVLLGIMCFIVSFRSGHKKFRRFAYFSAGALIVSCVIVYVLIPTEFVNINKYHAMTRGILMTSQNPEESLDEFQIDRQYSLLDGSIHFEKYPVIDVNNPVLDDDFYSRYGFVSITLYYLKHPGQLMQMLDYAARNAYFTRPEAMGNYLQSAGKPAKAKTHIFTLYSDLKMAVTPLTVGFILIWIACAVVLSVRNKTLLIVIITAILMGLSQIGVSIIGAGDADLSKHVFLYTVAFDFVNLIGYSALVTAGVHKWNTYRKKHPKKKTKGEVQHAS